MQRIRRTVKANVEGGFSVVDHVADLVLIRNLSDQAASYQFFIDSHFLFLLYEFID